MVVQRIQQDLYSITYNNFRGLNKLSSRLNMSAEFAWDIRNAYIKKDIKSGLGIIQQRSGSLKFNTVAFSGKCRYIYEPKWDGGSTDIIIRAGTKWLKFDGVNTFSDFDTLRTDDVRGQAVMFGNQLVMVDGGTPRKSTSAYAITNLSDVTKGTVTVTIATPGVFTFASHAFVAGQAVKFTTTGALPTGLIAGTTYYVISAGLTANDFQVSATLGGSAVNTSGSQSGVHTLYAFDANMPTDATAVHVHQHKVWLNSTANPMKAYCSKSDSANSGTSFTGTTDAATLDFSRILPDGDTLIGFATFALSYILFIFKNYIVMFNCGTDPATFELVQVIPVNCISWHTVQQVGNDLAFASLEGVNSGKSASLNAQIDTDDLSKYIAPYYRELLSELSNKEDVSSGFSHNLNHYYICMPISGNHTILVYSLDIKNFVGVWVGYEGYSFCERRSGAMLAGGEGYVRTMNVNNNDDGVAIDFQYSFPYLYFNDANRNKAVRHLEGIVTHDAAVSNFMINFEYNYGTNDDTQGVNVTQVSLSSAISLYREALYRLGLYRAAGSTRYLATSILGRGKQMSLDVYHSVLDAIIEIPYIIVRFKIEGEKIR